MGTNRETISLELAKKFKEAGIWLSRPEDYSMQRGARPLRRYTAQELRDRLPNNIQTQFHLQINKFHGNTHCNYIAGEDEPLIKDSIYGPTLAEALGEMYLYLWENGLLPHSPTKEGQLRRE